jgi:hypothetical protein
MDKVKPIGMEQSFHDELSDEADDFSVENSAKMDDDLEQAAEHERSELSLNAVLAKAKEEVDKEWAALPGQKQKLGEFMHEVIHLDDGAAEKLSSNVEVAKRLIAQHPDENILLKVSLDEEPAEDAGTRGMVRAEDLVSFERVEVVMPDGAVYDLPRTSIREIVGVSHQSAPLDIPPSATSYGGLGTDKGMVGRAGGPDEAEAPVGQG